MKRYVVNVEENAQQPWEKDMEITNLEVFSRSSTWVEYHTL